MIEIHIEKGGNNYFQSATRKSSGESAAFRKQRKQRKFCILYSLFKNPLFYSIFPFSSLRYKKYSAFSAFLQKALKNKEKKKQRNQNEISAFSANFLPDPGQASVCSVSKKSSKMLWTLFSLLFLCLGDHPHMSVMKKIKCLTPFPL